MAPPEDVPAPAPAPPGIPGPVLRGVLEVLGNCREPIRRRDLLDELEKRNHRISLAGLNRILDHLERAGTIEPGPNGVRLRPTR